MPLFIRVSIPFTYYLLLFYTMTYPNDYLYSSGFAYSKESGYDLFVLHTYDLPPIYITKINPKRPHIYTYG